MFRLLACRGGRDPPGLRSPRRWLVREPAVRRLGLDARARARLLGRRERGLGDHPLRRRPRGREGPGDVLELPRAAPARPPPADDHLDGRPRAHVAPQAGEQWVHAPPGARARDDGAADLHADHRPRRARGRVRLRVGHRRAADRRHARLPARRVRRLAAVVRRPHPGHHRGSAAGRGACGHGGDAGVPRVRARRDRRPALEAAARGSDEHPLLRRCRGP
jgi:hypothetical protein